VCDNEDGNEDTSGLSAVPGHPLDCDCGACVSVRDAPDDILVPDDFSIHRHKEQPMYVLTFKRSDNPVRAHRMRIIMQAHMLSSIGGLLIEHSMEDVASMMVDADDDEWGAA